MAEFKVDIYPDEIAEMLCGLAMNNKEPDEQLLIGSPVLDVLQDCEKALYQLKAIAENSYNSDYYRILYKVLEEIVKSNK